MLPIFSNIALFFSQNDLTHRLQYICSILRRRANRRVLELEWHISHLLVCTHGLLSVSVAVSFAWIVKCLLLPIFYSYQYSLLLPMFCRFRVLLEFWLGFFLKNYWWDWQDFWSLLVFDERPVWYWIWLLWERLICRLTAMEVARQLNHWDIIYRINKDSSSIRLKKRNVIKHGWVRLPH